MARWVPRWRKMTWLVVIFNILMLVWLIAGVGAAADNCEGLTGSELDACEAGTAVGGTIGAGIIIFLWALGNVILGVLWLVTKPRGVRDCPVCGNDVKRGEVVCRRCGYDFRAGRIPAQGQPPGQPF